MKASQDISFSDRIKWIIKKIPRGKVATYGQIAALAGNPLAARQVAWILHSSTRKDKLPWQRVINRFGRISLAPGKGYETQKALLTKEGLKFGKGDVIDLNRYLWSPRKVSTKISKASHIF
jgi:methylated-DNA-protein-cysteine methyltransferase related protein